ncbi:MAG: AraC family transcriptional regulator [Chloroflexota bacterium]|nr:AraC family transcriptional regulator [Chloroflexota bacterium]
MRAAKSREIYQSRLDRAITFINDHLSDDLNLEQIAQAAHFSPFHFHRIFAAIIGETPHKFMSRVRLERAANMLVKMPSFSITEIALACGFSSSATFARSFKKHFGVTASSYRKSGAALSIQPSAALHPNSGNSAKHTLTLDIQVKMMPRFHVAYVSSSRGYAFDQIYYAWNKIYKWAAARDLITPQSKMLGISFDDPLITPEDKCRYYACITIPEEITFDEKVGVMDIPGGKCATARLTCTAEEIRLAYRFFYTWFPDSGYQPAGSSYEVYYATPDTRPDKKYVLDVCVPVMPL